MIFLKSFQFFVSHFDKNIRIITLFEKTEKE